MDKGQLIGLTVFAIVTFCGSACATIAVADNMHRLTTPASVSAAATPAVTLQRAAGKTETAQPRVTLSAYHAGH